MGYEHGIYIKGLFPTALDVDKGHFTDSKYTTKEFSSTY